MQIVPPSNESHAVVRPYGHRRTFEEFIEDLKVGIEGFIGTARTRDTVAAFNAMVAGSFAEALHLGEEFEVAEGMRVIGGTIRCDDVSRDNTLQWGTDFTFPGARWRGQEGSVQPLGRFREYDLYIGFQGALPPTLIARYGHDGGDYLTYNPALQGGQPGGGVFRAALGRAIFTGVDLRIPA